MFFYKPGLQIRRSDVVRLSLQIRSYHVTWFGNDITWFAQVEIQVNIIMTSKRLKHKSDSFLVQTCVYLYFQL